MSGAVIGAPYLPLVAAAMGISVKSLSELIAGKPQEHDPRYWQYRKALALSGLAEIAMREEQGRMNVVDRIQLRNLEQDIEEIDEVYGGPTLKWSGRGAGDLGKKHWWGTGVHWIDDDELHIRGLDRARKLIPKKPPPSTPAPLPKPPLDENEAALENAWQEFNRAQDQYTRAQRRHNWMNKDPEGEIELDRLKQDAKDRLDDVKYWTDRRNGKRQGDRERAGQQRREEEKKRAPPPLPADLQKSLSDNYSLRKELTRRALDARRRGVPKSDPFWSDLREKMRQSDLEYDNLIKRKQKAEANPGAEEKRPADPGPPSRTDPTLEENENTREGVDIGERHNHDPYFDAWKEYQRLQKQYDEEKDPEVRAGLKQLIGEALQRVAHGRDRPGGGPGGSRPGGGPSGHSNRHDEEKGDESKEEEEPPEQKRPPAEWWDEYLPAPHEEDVDALVEEEIKRGMPDVPTRAAGESDAAWADRLKEYGASAKAWVREHLDRTMPGFGSPVKYLEYLDAAIDRRTSRTSPTPSPETKPPAKGGGIPTPSAPGIPVPTPEPPGGGSNKRKEPDSGFEGREPPAEEHGGRAEGPSVEHGGTNPNPNHYEPLLPLPSLVGSLLPYGPSERSVRHRH